MAGTRREARHAVEIWPGFVDALSTILLSFIFLLVVFVLGQFFLSQLLQGRDEAVGRLQGRVDELARQLEAERDLAAELRQSVNRLTAELQASFADRDDLNAQLGRAEQDRAAQEAEASRLANERLQLQRALDEAALTQNETRTRLAATRRELEEARRLIAVDRGKLEAQLGELVQLRREIETLQAVRGRLEQEVASLAGRVEQSETERQALLRDRERGKSLEAQLAATGEELGQSRRAVEARDARIQELLRAQAELEAARRAEATGKAEAMEQIRALTRQINALTVQLASLETTLSGRESEIERQSHTIASLGHRLNLALASKVEELSQFRSEFFGRLRRILGEREDVRVVGDRFVLQSEVLFGSGEADLRPSGQAELARLAQTLKQITQDLPPDLPWVLQVDGHTDRRPIATPRFPSNWELSTARAISVARFLVSQGLPPERVAARGLAEFQPLDPGDTEEAYRRNRRIELKLTTR